MHKRCRRGVKRGILVIAALITLFVPNLIDPGNVNAAPTTGVTIRKIAADGSTILKQQTVDYRWLMNNLPVMGDGVTHYYHQGPVFIDHPDEAAEEALRWNPAEDTNVDGKDMGAVQGTNLKDLCALVGGMAAGDALKVKARDGLVKTFAYRNVYQYTGREGPMVLCWFKDGQYPDNGYSEGMRLVWLADTSTNPWGLHVFGNWDWHSAAEERDWYYYQSGNEKYPTTTGLSVQNVAELTIYSGQTVPAGPKSPVAAFGADVTAGPAPLTVKFSDQSLNSPTTWAWDFENDGRIDSREMNPAFTFTQDGTYSVKLIVQNGTGSNEVVKFTYILVGGNPSHAVGPASPPELEQPEAAATPDQNSGLQYLILFSIIGLVVLGLTLKKTARKK